MVHAAVHACSAWFDRYVRSFTTSVGEDQRNFDLKYEHTVRVRGSALHIAAELGLAQQDTALAGIIAQYHDVGRFPQYRDYRTFRDSESVNHAALGAAELIRRDALTELPPEERHLVVRAVALHNVFLLPGGLAPRTALHARLVRDADKLDIWRIFTEILALPGPERPSAAGLGLPETPAYTPGILEHLRRREMVRLASLNTLNDFKLLQLAWVYDLNFLPSLRLVRERDVIGRLSATLPADAALRSAVDAVRRYVDERLAGLPQA
jgi:HD domain